MTTATKPATFQVGSFAVSRWGYDMTVVDFARVVKRTSSFIVLELYGEGVAVAELGQAGTPGSGYCLPGKPNGADPVRLKIQLDADGNEVLVSGRYVGAPRWRPWDGQPVRYNHWD
jgi:hypothetical protein